MTYTETISGEFDNSRQIPLGLMSPDTNEVIGVNLNAVFYVLNGVDKGNTKRTLGGIGENDERQGNLGV